MSSSNPFLPVHYKTDCQNLRKLLFCPSCGLQKRTLLWKIIIPLQIFPVTVNPKKYRGSVCSPRKQP